MGGGKGGGKPKMRVTQYNASVHYGVCMGPVDEVLEVWYGEKLLLQGRISANTSTYVAKPNLFGGEKVEGGFVGNIAFMLGGAGQQCPGALAGSLRDNGASATADPAKLPGYRGLLSFFIHGIKR